MKSDFLLIVPVLGAIICATYAGPIKGRRDVYATSQIDLLKLIDQIVNLQSSSVDDSQYAAVDLFSEPHLMENDGRGTAQADDEETPRNGDSSTSVKRQAAKGVEAPQSLKSRNEVSSQRMLSLGPGRLC